MSLLLAGFLPGQEHQGVGDWEARLIASAALDLIVVGVLEQHSITMSRHDDADAKEPSLTLRWRSLEPVTGEHANKVLAMIAEVRADRLGTQELPLVGQAAEESARRTGRRRQSRLRPVTT